MKNPTNNAAINLNGKQIYGYGDESSFSELPSYLFHLILNLKPEAMRLIKNDIKIGYSVTVCDIEDEEIVGKVEKIEGNKIVCGVNLPYSFIKRHHVTWGDILGY